MHAQLNYMIAQQRVADAPRAAEHAQLASDASAGRRRRSPRPKSIVRAPPTPTAHPSLEAWPAASLPSACPDMADEIISLADAVSGPEPQSIPA